MQENLNTNLPTNNEPTIVKTDVGAKDGQNKCPKCGATDISTNVNNGKLRCNFCRHEFELEKVEGLVEDISNLQGQVMGSGAQDIVADTNDVLTFKCSSCGAEVVIDTASSTQARCHWCRSTLSVNQQIPNGSIPDVVLPFNIKKEAAQEEIKKFVGKRQFFANPKFKKEFTTENIMGVYFPYMLIDANAHATLDGEGEHQVRRYTVTRGDRQETRYDADVYHVNRDFDLVVNGLSVESSSDRLNTMDQTKTNNIINSIMPFDTENCVKYNANYLRGYTSEKRDTNIETLKPIVETQVKDIARYAANDTLKDYDRGVRWENEQLDIKGTQWQAAYLPVWLYSYQEKKGKKSLLHYVAVNARTKETMGSVPIHFPKLFIVSTIIEIIGIILGTIIAPFLDDYEAAAYLLYLSGFAYFLFIYLKYRNSNARHTYELETKRTMSNLKRIDHLKGRRTGLSNSMIQGANNKKVAGMNAAAASFNNILNDGAIGTINNIINKGGK